jgi:hypothetical protein
MHVLVHEVPAHEEVREVASSSRGEDGFWDARALSPPAGYDPFAARQAAAAAAAPPPPAPPVAAPMPEEAPSSASGSFAGQPLAGKTSHF